MISIAHPDVRDDLERAARDNGLVPRRSRENDRRCAGGRRRRALARLARRHEVFGPLGITSRPFVDDAQSGRVGLIVETPSLAAFEEAMCAPGAAVALEADWVRPDTCVILTER